MDATTEILFGHDTNGQHELFVIILGKAGDYQLNPGNFTKAVANLLRTSVFLDSFHEEEPLKKKSNISNTNMYCKYNLCLLHMMSSGIYLYHFYILKQE